MVKLYNTIARKKQVFVPHKKNKVKFFVCGPTVYDYSHIGHARTYVIFDVLVKYLRQKKYDVFYLQNITDIDDKIIRRAQEKNINPKKLARDFEKEYLKDMKSLKVTSVSSYARATEHVPEIINQIKTLLNKKFAYFSSDGIYYDISKFKEYGKLSGRTSSQAEDAVTRIDQGVEKTNKGDFCLWKFSSPEEPKWKSPWGWGRPGWHIEDTAISEKFFGPQYDVHGGARDLIFPHHEAEIAQMEAASGKKPFVKYWIHTGFLTIKGEKMSKSLGNFTTIRNFAKQYSYRVLRFLIVKSHYRSPVDYDERNVKQSIQELKKIDELVNKLELSKNKKPRKIKSFKEMENKIFQSLENDFNTPLAISRLFRYINKINSALTKNEISAQQTLDFLEKLDQIFDFIIVPKKERTVKIKKTIPQEIKNLVEQRQKYRSNKEWQKADLIRKKIEKLGYQIEDTQKGVRIKN
jgi:cysteinyl-tRNA synthetase